MKITEITTIACLVTYVQSSSISSIQDSPKQHFKDYKDHIELGVSKIKTNIKSFVHGASKGPTDIFHKLHAKPGLRQTIGSLKPTQKDFSSLNSTQKDSSSRSTQKEYVSLNKTEFNSDPQDSNDLYPNNFTISNGTMNDEITLNLPHVYFVSKLHSDPIKSIYVPISGSFSIVWKINLKPKTELKGINIILEKLETPVTTFPIATNLSASTTNYTWNVFKTASNPNLTSSLVGGSNYRLFIFESGTDYLSANATKLIPGIINVTIFISPDASKKYNISSSTFLHSFSPVLLFFFCCIMLLRYFTARKIRQ